MLQNLWTMYWEEQRRQDSLHSAMTLPFTVMVAGFGVIGWATPYITFNILTGLIGGFMAPSVISFLWSAVVFFKGREYKALYYPDQLLDHRKELQRFATQHTGVPPAEETLNTQLETDLAKAATHNIKINDIKSEALSRANASALIFATGAMMLGIIANAERIGSEML